MGDILEWLKGKDLRSDGSANQAAEAVLQQPVLLEDLIDGLNSEEVVVRGRACDALEKMTRERPDLTIAFLPLLLDTLRKDRLMMVRMHLAMALGHLALYPESVPRTLPALLELLEDSAVFTRSWAIVSLCIIARLYPRHRGEIIQHIEAYKDDTSIAIRSKVRNAMEVLTDENTPFPNGWVKSHHLKL